MVKGATSKSNGWASEIRHKATGIEMVYVAPGDFMMGSPASEKDKLVNEIHHKVTLTKGYYIGKYEVTQEQWEKVMGSNPSYFKNAGNSAPVENVSWNDCQDFCKKLGFGFRLPTEAEWEYACRAGTATRFNTGDNESDLAVAGWYGKWYYDYEQKKFVEGTGGNSSNTTHPVGQKKPNALGIYDMSGNVWEWCQDWYAEYPAGSAVDPVGPSSGSNRCLRGGSWNRHARYCRSANRCHDYPSGSYFSIGFRVVLPAGQ